MASVCRLNKSKGKSIIDTGARHWRLWEALYKRRKEWPNPLSSCKKSVNVTRHGDQTLTSDSPINLEQCDKTLTSDSTTNLHGNQTATSDSPTNLERCDQTVTSDSPINLEQCDKTVTSDSTTNLQHGDQTVTSDLQINLEHCDQTVTRKAMSQRTKRMQSKIPSHLTVTACNGQLDPDIDLPEPVTMEPPSCQERTPKLIRPIFIYKQKALLRTSRDGVPVAWA